ncbi:peptidoglycan recognition protein 1-like [Macrosteles quadrilineatus]|uniref:peptidoglycan recognition protein 1-like n=1 Tax=Macrosteles quadrilineatus TaxID=74068 RepID=UPI0023E108B7|nr:peptidoglycan recognition protein 1-like [Macrosteles quadrilineatus]
MPPYRDLYPDFPIVRRQQWGAWEPRFSGKMWFPLSYIHTSYTNTATCLRPDNCRKELLFLQRFHMRNCPDIKHNFLISKSGKVFEGRGWLAKPSLPGRHRDIQYTSLYIGFIGMFKDELPNEKMMEAKEAILKLGIKHNFIRKTFLEFDLQGESLIENEGLYRYYQ